MAKKRLKIKFRIPPYESPRNSWRLKIHASAQEAMSDRGVTYSDCDKLSVEVYLYLREGALQVHDVDNRLKDILDALQGRVGGSKTLRIVPALIPNDNQIYRVTIEKKRPPWQSRGFGHVVVTRYVEPSKVAIDGKTNKPL